MELSNPTTVDCSSEPVPYKGPTVGYTGHGRRIAADNLYGATFADARKKADISLKRLINEREQNVVAMSETIPPVNSFKTGAAKH